MKPKAYDWIKNGVAVWYHPHIGQRMPRYAGIVDGEPWAFGGHTWVVHLCDMEASYRNGERKTVPAAALNALEPRT